MPHYSRLPCFEIFQTLCADPDERSLPPTAKPIMACLRPTVLRLSVLLLSYILSHCIQNTDRTMNAKSHFSFGTAAGAFAPYSDTQKMSRHIAATAGCLSLYSK